MKLTELKKYFKTDGMLVEGCFIMCPMCAVGSSHKEWKVVFLQQMAVGIQWYAKIRCPDCGYKHSSLNRDILDIAPPFR